MRRTLSTGIIRLALLLGLSTSLIGCGFILAPAQHGVARAAQLSVKGTDAGIAHGKEAAKTVSQAAISATHAAVDSLRPATARSSRRDRQPGPIGRSTPLP